MRTGKAPFCHSCPFRGTHVPTRRFVLGLDSARKERGGRHRCHRSRLDNYHIRSGVAPIAAATAAAVAASITTASGAASPRSLQQQKQQQQKNPRRLTSRDGRHRPPPLQTTRSQDSLSFMTAASEDSAEVSFSSASTAASDPQHLRKSPNRLSNAAVYPLKRSACALAWDVGAE